MPMTAKDGFPPDLPNDFVHPDAEVWTHLGQYTPVYPDEVAIMNAMTANLEGEVAEWMTVLHDEEALELGNIDGFLVEF
ncbi:hypothetical protein E2320_009381 [Naja naja]|nr:hypothetical protein E2320_009381 [Naja naja]